MKFRFYFLRISLYISLALLFPPPWQEPGFGAESERFPFTPVPILLYHRFGPLPSGAMTVTIAVFESHLKYLKENRYTVLSLRHLVDSYLGKSLMPPPSRAVVITADDGHRSVYTNMFPLIKKYGCPVTLFIYPSAISNASSAMTWGRLREMKESALFDFQSHTFWHPNFKKEKERLSPSEYRNFAELQLKKSKEKLEKELAVRVDMLAWPFGVYDDELIALAREAGYGAAFTMERRPARKSERIMALPRYLVANSDLKRQKILTNNPG